MPESKSASAFERAAHHYLERHVAGPAVIAEPPDPRLRLVVTVPAYDEPHLVDALRALADCAPLPGGKHVEVLAFVNAPADSHTDVRATNARARSDAEAFARHVSGDAIRIHVFENTALDPRDAGVGLARKTVMDEALHRLLAAQPERPGVIAAFDADCQCRPDYLTAIHAPFARDPALAGASINFEHVLESAADPVAIAHYESWLRYQRLALAVAGSRFAFHTIGSCMAVNALHYARLGGMNRRQAGEDFYFLQKFMATGRFETIGDTCVMPSARESSRVPFGTGAAMTRNREAAVQVRFPDIAAFDDLRTFLVTADIWADDETAAWAGLSEPLCQYLTDAGWPERLLQIRANSASRATFANHVLTWMNAFRTMKYVNFATHARYGAQAPDEAVRALATRLGCNISATEADDPIERLHWLRRCDRACT